jgi:hypothetical protein
VSVLPPGFADLEPWAADWSLPETDARHRKRATSGMADLTAFYEAAQPRLAEGLAYLDGFPLSAMPAPERRLLDLFLALADVALAVEKYREPVLRHARASIDFHTDTSALG